MGLPVLYGQPLFTVLPTIRHQSAAALRPGGGLMRDYRQKEKQKFEERIEV